MQEAFEEPGAVSSQKRFCTVQYAVGAVLYIIWMYSRWQECSNNNPGGYAHGAGEDLRFAGRLGPLRPRSPARRCLGPIIIIPESPRARSGSVGQWVSTVPTDSPCIHHRPNPECIDISLTSRIHIVPILLQAQSLPLYIFMFVFQRLGFSQLEHFRLFGQLVECRSYT